MKNLINSIEEAAELSERYSIPKTDIILAALNICGFSYNNENSDGKDYRMDRSRFRLLPDGEDRPFFIAASVNPSSSYFHSKNELLLAGKHVGRATLPEMDDCSQTYYRNLGRELTLNLNARSRCRGCKFCGTYKLKPKDKKIRTLDDVLLKAAELSESRREKNLSGLNSIGIVTGCFNSEEEALEHILNVRRAFSEYGFSGEIKYIGSEITSERAIKTLANSGRYGLYLTVECFGRRSKLLKRHKAMLSLQDGIRTLKIAKENGLETSFLYILGLDPLEQIKKEFPKYRDVLTRHPLINLMQNYTESQDSLRDSEAHSIDYYLKARVEIENVFKDTMLRPRLWENYRAPWATEYAGEKLVSQRI